MCPIPTRLIITLSLLLRFRGGVLFLDRVLYDSKFICRMNISPVLVLHFRSFLRSMMLRIFENVVGFYFKAFSGRGLRCGFVIYFILGYTNVGWIPNK